MTTPDAPDDGRRADQESTSTAGDGADRDGTDGLQAWVGRERRTSDVLTVERARKLASTLDLDPGHFEVDDPLPPGWHWVYFHHAAPRRALSDDGHERRGRFLPPVPLSRRMWAGGRLRFVRPLKLGSEVERISTIRSVEEKEGRTGPLVFVTVAHRILDGDGPALEEEQDLVYLRGPVPEARSAPEAETREDPSHDPGRAGPDQAGHGGAGRAGREGPGPTGPPPPGPPAPEEHRRTFQADEVTLFRFSALTFNGHRIHYDHRWATEVEGYPDLVVHGPLLALLLAGAGAEWAGREGPGLDGWRFHYRARQPAFCRETLELRGRDDPEVGPPGLSLRIDHARRGTLMEATLTPSCG